MAHSNSSISCFTNCMAKYEHSYILRTPVKRPPSPHLVFGSMAHEVLAKAGELRDAAEDGVVTKGEYFSIIPSEILHNDLKTEFAISSWEQYFTPVIQQTAAYEKEIVRALALYGQVTIEREIKICFTVEQMAALGYKRLDQPFVGVIDLLIYTPTFAVILDYKFSTNKKTQDDFDLDSQLPLYAMIINNLYNIPLRNIQYGYIDIPKVMYSKPTILTNGTLSRAKTQNCSQDMYKKAVIAIHGEDDETYNCNPGGHYYDAYNALAMNKAAYLSLQYLDMDVYKNVSAGMLETAWLIDYMKRQGLPFAKKYSAYDCKKCEYVNECYPWLTSIFR